MSLPIQQNEERGYIPAALPEDLYPYEAPESVSPNDAFFNYGDEYQEPQYNQPQSQPQPQSQSQPQPQKSVVEELYGPPLEIPQKPSTFVDAAVNNFAPAIAEALGPLVNLDDPQDGPRNRQVLESATRKIAEMMGVVGNVVMESTMGAMTPLYEEINKARKINEFMMDPDSQMALDLMHRAQMTDPAEAMRVAKFMKTLNNQPQPQYNQPQPQPQQPRTPPYRVPNTGTQNNMPHVSPRQAQTARALGVSPDVYSNPYFARRDR